MMARAITPKVQKAERAEPPLVLPSCSPADFTTKMKTDSAEQLDSIDSHVQLASRRHLEGKMKG